VAAGSRAAVVDLERTARELATSVVVSAVERLQDYCMVDCMAGYTADCMADYTVGCKAGRADCTADSMEDCSVAKEVAVLEPVVLGLAVLAEVDNRSTGVRDLVVDHQPQAGLGSVAAFAAEDLLVRLRAEVTKMLLPMPMTWEALEAVDLVERNLVHLRGEATRMTLELLPQEEEHLVEESLARSLV
jgi:hypothetical protein